MRSVGTRIRIAIVVVCAVVFLVCCGLLVGILMGYARDERVNDDINQGFPVIDDLEDKEATAEEGVKVLSDMSAEMKEQYAYLMELKATYPDVVGYVSIPSVDIRYPVVQTTNNEYYLDHLITGEKGSSGTVFVDCRCDPNPRTAKNTVLYGHNMNNRTMFHNIEKLFEKDEFLKGTVEYITEEGIFIYKPLSVYRANEKDSFDRYRFADDEAYLAYCEEVVEKSWFEESREVSCPEDSGVITFVTCTNFIKTERYIYQAVLDRIYLPED